MLIPRIITAVIFATLVVLGTFNLSSVHFYFATVFFVAWCAWEWTALINIKRFVFRCVCVLLFFVLFGLSFWLPLGVVWVVNLCWWLYVGILLFTYPRTRDIWSGKKVFGFIMGVISIIPSALALNVLRHYSNGAAVVLYALILIWIADSAAYFAGRFLGRRALAPALSPKKTWEGLFGGMAGSMIFSILGAVYFHLALPAAIFFIFISMLSAALSVLGDLYISMLKRERGVKDTGKLLPGHGGILDRVDGINTALPVFALGLMLLSWWFV